MMMMLQFGCRTVNDHMAIKHHGSRDYLPSAVDLIALTSSGLRTWNLNFGLVCLVCQTEELRIFFHYFRPDAKLVHL